MDTKVLNHQIAQIVQGTIQNAITSFFIAKSVRWKSERTAEFYHDELGLFTVIVPKLVKRVGLDSTSYSVFRNTNGT